ncbi:hypothetical protein Btru_033160 [Bulinus truncatus]|nr:hypothetical protein Btru_033160 [Bulinus truncatus]
MKTNVFCFAVLIALMHCLFGLADAQTTLCEEQGGRCIFMATAIACPIVMDASCGSSSHFCCKFHVRSVEEAEPKCQDMGGTCFHIAYQIHCPKKVNATCDAVNFYCCDLHH